MLQYHKLSHSTPYDDDDDDDDATDDTDDADDVDGWVRYGWWFRVLDDVDGFVLYCYLMCLVGGEKANSVYDMAWQLPSIPFTTQNCFYNGR